MCPAPINSVYWLTNGTYGEVILRRGDEFPYGRKNSHLGPPSIGELESNNSDRNEHLRGNYTHWEGGVLARCAFC